MKIMVVEDEAKVRNLLRNGLSRADFMVETARDLDELLANLSAKTYDVIVLDRMLGGVDAVKYIPDIRQKMPGVRILVLSAMAEVNEKVEGLTSGADDYLAKPFHIAELVARIQAVARRTPGPATENHLAYKDLVIVLDTQQVRRGSVKIDLTPKEYKLLVFFVKKPNTVFSKSEIINAVWELQHHPESNIVEVIINHLRSKIDKHFGPPLIHSKRGVGYWFGEISR